MLSRHGSALRQLCLKPVQLRALSTSHGTSILQQQARRGLSTGHHGGRRRETEVPEHDSGEVKPPVESLLAKQARLDKTIKRSAAISKGKAASAAARAAGIEPPPKKKSTTPKKQSTRKRGSVGATAYLLVQSTKSHHDLQSFVDFTKKHGLSTLTSVYKGTHFEYTVAEALKTFGFDLHRTGKSNDLGIDLLGTWRLPGQKEDLKVFVQCKVTRPMPATVRELEGAYVGAPAGWQGGSTIALLVSSKPATKGVVTAVQRSKSPIGVLQIDGDGVPKQFLWNAVAGESGLAGLGVTAKYKDGSSVAQVKSTLPGESIALTWKGRPMHAVTSPDESGRLV